MRNEDLSCLGMAGVDIGGIYLAYLEVKVFLKVVDKVLSGILGVTEGDDQWLFAHGRLMNLFEFGREIMIHTMVNFLAGALYHVCHRAQSTCRGFVEVY